MWVGIVLGLLIGAATGSPWGALILAVAGGVIGRAVTVSQAKDASGDSAAPEGEQLGLEALREQVRLANRRIDLLEMRLCEAGIPEVACPQTAPEAAAPQAVASGELPAQDEELASQALDDDAEPLPATGSIALGATGIPVAYSSLEEVMASGETVDGTPAEPRSRPQPAWDALEDRSAEPPAPAMPAWLSEFVARWITGGNPLVKIGVLILFLGLAFLLRYVAEHTTVRVEFRYAGVAAVGIALLLGGWRWRHRADNYGLILQGAGIGVLYLTTLAGMKLHPLIPLEAGFAILAGVAAFAALLAILEDAPMLAAAGSLGGFAAPVLASSGSEHHLGFFAYLALLMHLSPASDGRFR
jgi:uncharacterized membrane protein